MAKLPFSNFLKGPLLDLFSRTIGQTGQLVAFLRRHAIEQVRWGSRSKPHVIFRNDRQAFVREAFPGLDAPILNRRANQPDSLRFCDVGIDEHRTHGEGVLCLTDGPLDKGVK